MRLKGNFVKRAFRYGDAMKMNVRQVRPEHEPRAAALALSLLTGGVEYFTATVDAVGSPTREQRVAVDAAFASARSAVERNVRENRIDALSDIWSELRQSLKSVIDPKRWEDLRAALP
jgi:hypothetical protein